MSDLVAVKQKALDDYGHHVNPFRLDFFKQLEFDFVLGKREGAYIWDADGRKRFYNLHCNGGVFNFGHRNPLMIEALREALSEVDLGIHTLPSVERALLGKLLADLMPGDLKWSIFASGGGEANDVAIKIVRGYTGRRKVISAIGGYHGHTGLSIQAGDAKYLQQFLPFGQTVDLNFVKVPFGDIEALAAAIDEDTAAVILETVPATIGMKLPPAGYFEAVRALCDEWQTQMIIDEVQTGLGRTGKLWAMQHFGNFVPDVVVLGKGLSGGVYPIAVTCFRPHLAEVFRSDPFSHISTFGGSDLGCRIARLVLEQSSSAGFLSHVNLLAEKWRLGLAKLKDKHNGFVLEVRQLGLFMALKMRNEYCGLVLSKCAIDNGLWMVYANNDTSCIQILPPLIQPLEDVDILLPKLDAAIAAARKLVPLLMFKRAVEKVILRRKTPPLLARGILPLAAMQKRAAHQQKSVALAFTAVSASSQASASAPKCPVSLRNLLWFAGIVLAMRGALSLLPGNWKRQL